MSSKKKDKLANTSLDEGASGRSSGSTISLSQEQFLILIQEIKNSSAAANNHLLNAVLTREATPSRDANSENVNPVSGNFVKCTARFDGSPNSDVDSFIDAVITYEDCSNVSDSNALRGLSMLLEGVAATWWQGIKATINTWDEAISNLKDSYPQKLPAPLIFREIFSREQNDDETTELFVCRIRASLSQLPYVLEEKVQLDMVYGLLHREIKKRLPRVDFDDFKNFLKRVRDTENSLKQPVLSVNTGTSHKTSNVKADNNETKKLRPECTYCRNFGHIKEDCRKLKQSGPKAKSDVSSSSQSSSGTRPQLVCYGCGAPGTVRSKCSKCSSKKDNTDSLQVQAVNFSQTTVCQQLFTVTSRPLLPISIAGVDGVGFADSVAHVSIAGYSLYGILQQKGFQFANDIIRISYADGIIKEEEILQTTVDVGIRNRVVPITLIVLPKLKNNRTLLGVDFLDKARICLNISEDFWYFCDASGERFNFFSERDVPSALQFCEVQQHQLRCDEAQNLNANQRSALTALLTEYQDIFEPGGETTPFAEHKIDTQDCAPIAVSPYSLSEHKKKFLRDEIDNLLANDIIEECESPWAFPTVVVPKKNGSYRLCIDFRKLNAVTVKDKYPMPRLDELLQTPKKTPFMSTIDLQSGYYQASIAEQDRDKTCFVSPFGAFRFKRMAFGLCNALGTFMRLMDRFRAGLKDRAVYAYLDDILKLSGALCDAKQHIIRQQERQKKYVDQHRRDFHLKEGDKVLIKTHILSSLAKGITSKFSPKRDGPYLITKVVSPSTYELSSCQDLSKVVGRYHVSDSVCRVA